MESRVPRNAVATIILKILNSYICTCAELTLNPLSYISDNRWTDLIAKVEHFFRYYELTKTKEYQDFTYVIQSNNYSSILNEGPEKRVLRILIDLKNYKNTVPKFFDRVFISHSSLDKDIVGPFVKMLTSIGLDRNKLFCSSIDGYGIPQRENIYDFLKREFTEKNTFVVIMMSDNYYNSKPSLNEMGAAWAMSKEYVSILIKGFDFKQIEGAVDAQKIGFKIDDKYRLDEFKDNIIKEFRLSPIGNWQEIKDRFLEEIESANQIEK